MTTYYFAYGANTNMNGMDARCPAATPLGVVTLRDYRLVFRGVADIVEHKGATVRGALWQITKECEEALDRFEGFPHLYVKIHFMTKWEGKLIRVMAYVMKTRDWECPPHDSYEDCLRHGYKDFGLPVKQLDAAVQAATGSYAKNAKQRRRDFNAYTRYSHWLEASDRLGLDDASAQ
jgi:gamma-glutamylcyclotransferase (GGCT)/AIG2-like uncharacterized protein YtfP